MTKPFLLGVLGGMGPLATLDFQRRLLDATPAQNDQQQIPSVARATMSCSSHKA